MKGSVEHWSSIPVGLADVKQEGYQVGFWGLINVQEGGLEKLGMAGKFEWGLARKW